MVEMQAAQLRRFGGPEVLEVATVQRPEPGPGEVLVRVAASGVNPHDAFVRQGTLKWQTGRRFPLGVGLDFAGEVISTGDQVDETVTGNRVWGMVSPPQGHRTAAAAQFVAVPADRVAPFPQRLSMVEAASLVTSATTAVHALCDIAKMQAGARVLVRGAAGGGRDGRRPACARSRRACHRLGERP